MTVALTIRKNTRSGPFKNRGKAQRGRHNLWQIKISQKYANHRGTHCALHRNNSVQKRAGNLVVLSLQRGSIYPGNTLWQEGGSPWCTGMYIHYCKCMYMYCNLQVRYSEFAHFGNQRIIGTSFIYTPRYIENQNVLLTVL